MSVFPYISSRESQNDIRKMCLNIILVAYKNRWAIYKMKIKNISSGQDGMGRYASLSLTTKSRTTNLKTKSQPEWPENRTLYKSPTTK